MTTHGVLSYAWLLSMDQRRYDIRTSVASIDHVDTNSKQAKIRAKLMQAENLRVWCYVDHGARSLGMHAGHVFDAGDGAGDEQQIHFCSCVDNPSLFCQLPMHFDGPKHFACAFAVAQILRIASLALGSTIHSVCGPIFPANHTLQGTASKYPKKETQSATFFHSLRECYPVCIGS